MRADYMFRCTEDFLDDIIEIIQPEANVFFWPKRDKVKIFSEYFKSNNDPLINCIQFEFNIELVCFELEIFCNEYYLNKSKLMYGTPKFVLTDERLVADIEGSNINFIIKDGRL